MQDDEYLRHLDSDTVMGLQRVAVALSFVLVAVGCSSNDKWANRHLQRHLNDVALDFKSIRSNEEISVPGILATGPLEAGACVTLSFPRGAFEEGFLKDLIAKGASSQKSEFIPFTSPGIETILRSDDVLIKVHAGTIVHIRDDVLYGGHKAFRQGTRGRVVWLEGDVVHAEPKAQPSLRKFVILPVSESIDVSAQKLSRQPDGSHSGTLNIGQDQVRFAPTFAPRVSSAGATENRCASGRRSQK